MIPAYNEQESIAAVITELKQAGFSHLYIVDDASTDETIEVAKSTGVTVIPLLRNLGAWKATQTGLRHVYHLGYSQAVTFDADGQHQASSIQALLHTQWEQGSDVVIGSCSERGSASRQVAWQYFRMLTGLNIADLTSGLRLYNLSALRVLSANEATMLDYQDLGVLLLLRQAQLSIAEAKVTMRQRGDGISRIFSSWRAVIDYMLYSSFLCLSKTSPSNTLKLHSTLKRNVKDES
ncbi:glycosyltransferase family 2 protein [Motilimonas pumila]|uniref:glycosyltransferase family 2 protein n=1 Tax=Motilimonas pumila TaxID=2303987 RepID=UPI001E3967B3|nr:glycosyltransferase family 2 protein [Motilimonas pumila]